MKLLLPLAAAAVWLSSCGGSSAEPNVSSPPDCDQVFAEFPDTWPQTGGVPAEQRRVFGECERRVLAVSMPDEPEPRTKETVMKNHRLSKMANHQCAHIRQQHGRLSGEFEECFDW